MSSVAQDAVLKPSESLEGVATVQGYDFNEGVDYEKLFKTYVNTGFQARNLGLAIEEVNKMLRWRLSDDAIPDDEANEEFKKKEYRENTKCKIFFGYTSNLVSSGLREMIRYLAEHKLIDVMVTTAGGIEEDIIKCLAPTHVGDFQLDGRSLRDKGINRIGNLLVPNDNYCKFEDFFNPILDAMVREQEEEGVEWTPSKLIHRLGKEINNPSSIYYWCYKNDIPVFSPAITDGSIGDMIYFHTYRSAKPLKLDIVQDIKAMNDQALKASHVRKKTGMLIVGGGLVKHHICNANLMKNGADFSVFINTASEFDGSDSGARPDEAISWGKISADAKPVKVYAEATLVLPILVAESFVKYNQLKKKEEEGEE
eukprot:CAMPEP_0201482878 /NCGR_PEP_ID=MMETSP0151_2-20130828/7143_1 /ASSEMBLY_ACC=CAM_ASM_000257 /TAXON_ID=200890 /ORGANISM="Paramoeba atlantica, Strain 621/1 / CCAP 1560/9" /LENGTH=368 /DNA_ID=CAMNT_0047865787 /DNA_START=58 /DNA_END=1161 /DNA_ORIENTATION=-